MKRRIDEALARIRAEVHGVAVVVGYPKVHDGALRNMAGVIVEGQLVYEYAKQQLKGSDPFQG